MPTLVDLHGNPMRSEMRSRAESAMRDQFYRRLKAKYDAAQTTDENERHWANADYLSPNAAMSPAVRRKLRSRARYEAQENNSYAKGMLLTLANDLVGTGPRLQLLTEDRDANRRVERSFLRWSKEVRLAEKLRTMRIAKVTDGEAWGMLTTNQNLVHSVKLDVRPFESDMVEAPWDHDDVEADGIRFDEYGNAAEYYVLSEHPGSYRYAKIEGGRWIPAEDVLHLFRCDRPGQNRGLTELVTALPLFAMLRRFTLATLAAAETAADFAAVMRTTASPTVEAETLPEDQWFDAIPLEYRAMLTLPNGWDITQLKAEHPATTFEMFKRELINEIARCLNMPYNVAAANSSSYNYASGRMDHQVYFRSIAVDQSQLECAVMDAILVKWLDEAAMVPGLLPETGTPIADWDWFWFWDAPMHVDPQKEATAQATRLASHTTTLADEYARRGQDWEEQIRQRARELTLMSDLGIQLGSESASHEDQTNSEANHDKQD